MTKSVLTIDDSKTILDMLDFTLRKAGYDVLQAKDGHEGLAVLAANDVDVIITDINMPVMDGITFIQEARKDPTYNNTPILVLTTETSDKAKNLARVAGATGWLVKPFSPQKLLAVIRKVSP